MTERMGHVGFRARDPRFPSSKFSVPTAGSHMVHRSRLFDQLARGEQARLTLVVGSPGAGRPRLLDDWVATCPERPLAWLSCDVADADPVRFIAAVIGALQRAPGRYSTGLERRARCRQAHSKSFRLFV